MPLAHGEGAENISREKLLRKINGLTAGTRGEAEMEPSQGKQASVMGHGINTVVSNCSRN